MQRSVLIVVVLAIGFLLINNDSYGQMSDSTAARRNPFWKKVQVGGNLGLAFGSVTVVDVSPSIGYKVTEKFVPGIGATYLYYNDTRYQYKTSVYGGRLFSQYRFTENLFGYGEYEVLNGEFDRFEPSKRINVASLLAGGGYMARIGQNSVMYIMVLWNFNDGIYSPHGSNPVFRSGFSIGL